jgi:hypothetical protein
MTVAPAIDSTTRRRRAIDAVASPSAGSGAICASSRIG